MRRLIEIPVYAYSKEELQRRINIKYEKIRNKYLEKNLSIDEKHLRQLQILQSSPYSYWEYNHIVRYLIIGVEKQDLIIEEYVPHESRKWFKWDSPRKVFLVNNHTPGLHFRMQGLLNEVIAEKTRQLVIQKTEEYVEKGFFVDLECFNNVYENIDYTGVNKDD